MPCKKSDQSGSIIASSAPLPCRRSQISSVDGCPDFSKYLSRDRRSDDRLRTHWGRTKKGMDGNTIEYEGNTPATKRSEVDLNPSLINLSKLLIFTSGLQIGSRKVANVNEGEERDH